MPPAENLTYCLTGRNFCDQDLRQKHNQNTLHNIQTHVLTSTNKYYDVHDWEEDYLVDRATSRIYSTNLITVVSWKNGSNLPQLLKYDDKTHEVSNTPILTEENCYIVSILDDFR